MVPTDMLQSIKPQASILVIILLLLNVCMVVSCYCVFEVVTIRELPFIYTTPVSETSRGMCEAHLNRLLCTKSNASGGLCSSFMHSCS